MLFEGVMECRVGNGRVQRIEAPNVLLFRQGLTQQLSPAPGFLVRFRYLLVSGSWLDDWTRYGWFPATWRAFPLLQPSAGEDVHHDLLRAIRRSHRDDLDEAKLALARWMMRASRDADPAPRSTEARIRAAVQDWNGDASADWAAMAARCGVSVSRFRALFRRVHGLAPHEFECRQRIDRACALIARRPDDLLKQIAFASGFENVETFNRQFLKFKGLTPGKFRKLLPG